MNNVTLTIDEDAITDAIAEHTTVRTTGRGDAALEQAVRPILEEMVADALVGVDKKDPTDYRERTDEIVSAVLNVLGIEQ